ncbi:MAG: hypothetical protein IJM51_00520 [Clostridia bacterium]|nr:hypothetical protein [Clostridia bacterium]
MNQRKLLKKQLGDGYSYEKIKSSNDVRRILSTAEPLGFDMVVSSLTVGCVRLEAVLYQQSGRKKLGYDLFVKDTPTGQEWICYDNLTDEVRIGAFNFEQEMFNVLNAYVVKHGLSYTECSFEKLEGKP